MFRGDRDALDGRAGGDHRGRGHGLLRARVERGWGLSRNIVGGAGALIDGIAAELAGRDRRRTPRCSRSPTRASSCACATARAAPSASCCARHAIVATKAFDAARLIRDLPADTSSALNAIPYGPTVVMAMLTNETRPMPWDDLYALATPKRAFNMLFNTVNVLRPRSAVRAPGGSLMVYRAGPRGARRCSSSPTTVVEQAFLDDLYAIYPEARGIVSETMMLKLPRMLPYAAPGRSALQPALERPLGRIHLAGDYLGGVYTDTAISSGQEAALAVRAALQAAEQPRA